MAFVADNSVILGWFVQSQANSYTERMLAHSAAQDLHVPRVWPLEFANALRQLERRRRIGGGAVDKIIDAAERLPLKIDQAPPTMRRLVELARAHDLSVYDASYLELAIRLSVPLAVKDKPLAAIAHRLSLIAS